jgi:hypothetical protein
MIYVLCKEEIKMKKVKIIHCGREDYFEKATGEFLTKHGYEKIDYVIQDGQYYAFIIYEEVEENGKDTNYGRRTW